MRNRIFTTQIDGKIKPIAKRTTFFGEECTAVLVTSETPEHAQSNIRKVLAYKKMQQRRNRTNTTLSNSPLYLN